MHDSLCRENKVKRESQRKYFLRNQFFEKVREKKKVGKPTKNQRKQILEKTNGNRMRIEEKDTGKRNQS